jgi:hypothetical protein
MDHLKIPRKGKTKNGKLLPLTLHARLERYEEKNADVASKLLAVKWLGNIGSHTGELAHSDVLDAFELISFALDEVFEKKSDRLKRMAEKIIRHKGPSGAKNR